MKISNLRPDEIYSLFDIICELRKDKKYFEADSLRKIVESLGYFHYMPKIINTGNLSGVMEQKLRITFGDKNIIEGIIHLDEEKFGISTEIYCEI